MRYQKPSMAASKTGRRFGPMHPARLLLLTLALAGIFCLQAASTQTLREADRLYAGMVQLRLSESPVTAEAAWRAGRTRTLEQEQALYTWWTQRSGVSAAGPGENAVLLPEALFFTGDTSEGFPVLSETGCALTPADAHRVFGSEDVLGEPIVIEGRRCFVERILEDPKAVSMVKTDRCTGLLFDVLNVRPQNMAAADWDPGSLLYREALNPGLIIRYDDLLPLLLRLRILPFWIAALSVSLFLLIRRHRGRGAWWDLPAAVLLPVFCGLLLGSPFHLPDALIPARWSDFSFWSERFVDLQHALRYILQMQAGSPDLWLQRQFLLMPAVSAASVLLLSAAWRFSDGLRWAAASAIRQTWRRLRRRAPRLRLLRRRFTAARQRFGPPDFNHRQVSCGKKPGLHVQAQEKDDGIHSTETYL